MGCRYYHEALIVANYVTYNNYSELLAASHSSVSCRLCRHTSALSTISSQAVRNQEANNLKSY